MFRYFLVVIIVAIIILLLSSLFIGLGFVLAQIYHFSLFEATLICLLTSLALLAFLIMSQLFFFQTDDEEDEDDFDLEFDDMDQR